MTPIIYADGVSNDSTQTNFRIDALENKYVLRACEFTHAGKVWKLPNDVAFEGDVGHPEYNLDGWLTAQPDGKVSLVVMDKAILKKISSSDEDKHLLAKYYETVGRDRLLPVFTTISQHYVVATKKSIKGRFFLVTRCLKRGTIPADKVDSVPTSNVDIAFEESHPAITYAPVLRARVTHAKVQQQQMSEISKKSWDQLNSDEQMRVMRETAERMGIIKKVPVPPKL